MPNSNLLIGVIAALLGVTTWVEGQSGTGGFGNVTHSSSFKFVQRDGTCVYGKILKADATSITVQSLTVPSFKKPFTLQRDGLLQISQGNALVYTARSSWADVSAATLYPREALVLTLKSGAQVKGKPVETSSDSITLKHGLRTTVYPKFDIATVDSLRVKPATDGFTYVLEEAPWMLVFDPEFYYRASGLAGKMQVRLYDATKPEDDAPVECRSWQ